MNWKHAVIFCVCLLMSFGLGWYLSHQTAVKVPGIVTEIETDTLYVHDTITLKQAVFVTKTRVDSVLVPVRDTIRERDTLYVYLEREQVTWEDKYCKVYASGIRPAVDSVTHYLTTATVTQTVTKKARWGLGVQAGLGVSTQGLTPYVGVGLSWNILTF